MGKLLAWLGLVVGVVALLTQFVISMQSYAEAGRDVPGSLGMFFSYYTVLSNIVLVLIYLAELAGVAWLGWFRSLDTRGMMVAAMLLVMTFVHIFLRGLTPKIGLFPLCDALLHYVTPLIYFVWWIVGVKHGPLLVRRVPLMLVPTLFYFVYVLARGAWVGDYPYPVINVDRIGYPQTLLHAAAIAIGLGALMLIVVGIDEVLGRWALRNQRPAAG